MQLAIGALSLPPGPIVEHHKGLLDALHLHLPKVSTTMCCRPSVLVPPTCDPHRIRSPPDGQQLMPSPLASIVEEPDEDKYTRNLEILAAGTS